MVKYHEKDYRNVVVNDFRNYLWERDSAENTIDDYCRSAKSLEILWVSLRLLMLII